MSVRVIVVLTGLVSLAAGVFLLNTPPGTLPWVPAALLERHVGNPSEFLAGLVVALLGASLAVWATRGKPEKAPLITADPARPPRPRRARLLAGLFVLAGGFVAVSLATRPYTHLVFQVFVAALALGALALRDADRRQRRRTELWVGDLAVALALGALTTWLHARGAGHWLFTSIGDEMPFFEAAAAVARGEGTWNAFDVVGGVYGTHAFLDTAYQAWVMQQMERVDVLSWRYAEAAVAGASAGLLFLTGVVLRGRATGLAAAAVLGSSHYLMAFSHIGYNNSHAVFYNVLAAFALSLAWRTGRWHHHWLAGVALGACLYTFLAAAAFWIVASLVLVTEMLIRRAARHRLAVAFVVLGFAATVAPAFRVTTTDRLTQVVSRNSVELGVAHHAESLHQVRATTLVQSILSFWADGLITGHHLGGPLVDPVTGGLLLLGVIAAAAQWRGFAQRLALLWFAGGLVLVAISHYEPTPSTSRLLVVLPAVGLLCGLAVDRLLPYSGCSRYILAAVICVGLWAGLPRLNLHQLFTVSPRKMVPKRTVMVMKALQEHPGRDVVDVGTSPEGDMPGILAAYPWLQPRYHFLSEEQLGAGEPLPVQRDPVFYVDPASAHLADVLAPRLPAGYRRLEDQEPTGSYRAVLFVPTDVR